MKNVSVPFSALAVSLLAGVVFAAHPAGDAAPLPPLKHSIAVIAHRAGRGIRPENTLSAIRNAIKLGVDYVELDIRATKDGKLVIMHDRSVDRTTDGKGNVKDLALDEIRKLDAGVKFDAKEADNKKEADKKYAGEKVPTFDEVLSLCCNEVYIYVDHKEAPTQQVFDAIKAHKMEKQVVVYNGTEGLQEWKRIAPHIPVMPSLPDEFRKPGGVAEYRKILAAEVLDGNLVEWTKELVDDAHAAGAKVYVDNLGPNDNPAGFRKAIEMGVDGIQTDYPDQLLKTLSEIAAEKPAAK